MTNESVSDWVFNLINKTVEKNYQFTEESIFAREREAINCDSRINNTIALISLLFDACREQLSGYFINLDNNLPLAAFSCYRTYLETAALCAWLSDPSIDAIERHARQLTYRANEQIYLIQPFKKEADFEALRKTMVDRLQDFAKEAMEYRISPVLDTKNNIIGIGKVIPNFSALINKYFDLKPIYSYLSNIIHGHQAEMTTAGGKVGEEVIIDGMVRVKINTEPNPEFIKQLEISLRISFLIVCTNIWVLFGWEELIIEYSTYIMNDN